MRSLALPFSAFSDVLFANYADFTPELVDCERFLDALTRCERAARGFATGLCVELAFCYMVGCRHTGLRETRWQPLALTSGAISLRFERRDARARRAAGEYANYALSDAQIAASILEYAPQSTRRLSSEFLQEGEHNTKRRGKMIENDPVEEARRDEPADVDFRAALLSQNIEDLFSEEVELE